MRKDIWFKGKRVDNDEWVEGYYTVCWKNHASYIVVDVFERTDHGGLLGDRKEALAYKVYPETVKKYLFEDTDGEKVFDGDFISIIGYSYDECEIEEYGQIIATVFGNEVICDSDCGQKPARPLYDLQGSYKTEIYKDKEVEKSHK